MTEPILLAGEVALELLAWDKARATAVLDRPSADEDDRLVDRGAECYRGLLSVLHGERAFSAAAIDEWLEESRRARRDRPEMTERGSLLSRDKLKLTDEDLSLLDRKQPELSCSALRSERQGNGDRTAPDADRASEDPVAQLKGLRELHAVGALTDEEFEAAKARVIDRM